VRRATANTLPFKQRHLPSFPTQIVSRGATNQSSANYNRRPYIAHAESIIPRIRIYQADPDATTASKTTKFTPVPFR
jgi:hypothetical protein